MCEGLAVTVFALFLVFSQFLVFVVFITFECVGLFFIHTQDWLTTTAFMAAIADCRFNLIKQERCNDDNDRKKETWLSSGQGGFSLTQSSLLTSCFNKLDRCPFTESGV